MPAKKREVVSFVTRLNPALVRTLDAYAELSRLSRNQVIERWLEEHFQLNHQLNSYREFERALNANRIENESPEKALEHRFEDEEYEKLCRAESLGKGKAGKKKPAGK